MNTNESKNAAGTRELTSAELASVSGGFSAFVAKMCMELKGATPSQGEQRGGGLPVSPEQQAKLGI
jgi:hypothetical protein